MMHVIWLLFLSLSLTATGQVTCTVFKNSTCGNPNGIISAVASFGTGPYIYSIDGEITYQNSGYFARLYPGNYTIIAKDAMGATATGTCSITGNFSAPALGVTTSGGIPSCLVSNGTLTATAWGGTPPYEYSMDAKNWQSNGIFTNIPGGFYTVIVRDANGCTGINLGIPMPAPCTTVGGTLYIIANGCMATGSITFAKDANNTHSYLFSLDGINYTSNSTFSNLDAGVYSLHIKDESGSLIGIQGVTVSGGCEFSILTDIVHSTCSLPTGNITATAQGGASPYRYSLNGINFQNSGVFENLPPGNYTVVAMDADGNVTSELIPIYNGCINLSVNATNPTCGGNNGILTATASGGTPPYQYSIDGSNFQAGNTFSSLPPGSYQVTVSDKNGMKKTSNATINGSINDLGLTTNVQPATCVLNNGSFTITAFGGLPPYEYSIDHINYQSSNTFSNLYYDQYPAMVRDALGCMFITYPVHVPYVCFRVTGNTLAAQCGNNNGSITLSTVDGNAPYQYSINGINFQSNPVFTSLTPGSYTVTAKDANNSTATVELIVENSCININTEITNSACGNPNGTIKVTATNGTIPYSYSIDGINFSNSNTITGLAAGQYTVIVKDNNGATGSAQAIINNIPGPLISANITPATCDNNDGSIAISANGGTLPILYAINEMDFQAGSTFTNLSYGNHKLMIKDANGCTATDVVTVPLDDDLTLTTGNDITICEGVSITLFANSNGNNFSWTPANSLTNAEVKNPMASPLSSTQYFVTAEKGVCIQTKMITVFVTPAPISEAGEGEAICFGNNSKLNASGGVNYLWTPDTYLSDATISNPIVLKPINTITYSLTVINANNCTSTKKDQVTITVIPQAKLFAGNDTIVAINQPVKLSAIDVNNSGFIDYKWSPDYGLDNPYISSPLASLDKDITYEVIAKTSAGCESADQLSIRVYKGPDIYVPNAFTPNNDGRNDLLMPVPIGIKELKYFIIYNRWGQQIYRTTTLNQGWDGRINGVSQGGNSYVWVAEGTDYNGKSVRRKGIAVLVR